jgi:hypothetical protein
MCIKIYATYIQVYMLFDSYIHVLIIYIQVHTCPISCKSEIGKSKYVLLIFSVQMAIYIS